MIKLIASDMDGTLINSKHEISEGNLTSIRKAQEKGITFAIATGRDYKMVKPFLDKYNLKCEAIVMNGAEYRDEEGNILGSISIEKYKVKLIIEEILKVTRIIELYTNKGVFVNKISEEEIEASINRIKQFNKGMSRESILKVLNELRKQMTEFEVEDIDKIIDSDTIFYKIITFDDNKEVIRKLKEKIGEIGGLAVASTSEYDIEVNDEKAQKGLILSKVAKIKNIENDEVMVLGDSFNDYSMFTTFKNSYAMENAINEIKEIATYITDSNDNDGVAKAIDNILNMHIFRDPGRGRTQKPGLDSEDPDAPD